VARSPRYNIQRAIPSSILFRDSGILLP